MKSLPKTVVTAALVLFGTLASGAAMADYYGHRHPSVRFGVSLGVPIYGPGFYPAPYYPYAAYPYPYAYPPVVVTPSSPPVYIEQPQTQSAAPAQAQGDWYYCAASKAYYPYVTECPAGWQRVPAQPPAR
jgi:hypothetical protein